MDIIVVCVCMSAKSGAITGENVDVLAVATQSVRNDASAITRFRFCCDGASNATRPTSRLLRLITQAVRRCQTYNNRHARVQLGVRIHWVAKAISVGKGGAVAATNHKLWSSTNFSHRSSHRSAKCALPLPAQNAPRGVVRLATLVSSCKCGLHG